MLLRLVLHWRKNYSSKISLILLHTHYTLTIYGKFPSTLISMTGAFNASIYKLNLKKKKQIILTRDIINVTMFCLHRETT